MGLATSGPSKYWSPVRGSSLLASSQNARRGFLMDSDWMKWATSGPVQRMECIASHPTEPCSARFVRPESISNLTFGGIKRNGCFCVGPISFCCLRECQRCNTRYIGMTIGSKTVLHRTHCYLDEYGTLQLVDHRSLPFEANASTTLRAQRHPRFAMFANWRVPQTT